MYVPDKFKEEDVHVLHELVCSHPLGTWVTTDTTTGELDINHIPFLLETTLGNYGTLKGHVNKANPVWKSLNTKTNSVVVFQGPETYITPSWYASKQEHGKAVPTWNYAVVHAHGTPRVIDNGDWLLDHLHALTNTQEQKHAQPWSVSDAPQDYIERMLRGIVGIEIPIIRLVGAWKTSQNKQQADKKGIIAGLNSLNDSQSAEMASYVSKHTSFIAGQK